MKREDFLADRELPFLLALLRAPKLGAATLMRLFDSGLSPESICTLSSAALTERGVQPAALAHIQAPDWSVIDNDRRWLEQYSNHLITFTSPYYPKLLKQIHDPPVALFVKGNPEVLGTIQLGMVGSRHPSADGRRLAQNFARQLAALGFTITSGLALGIDSYSHIGAIEANGVTIAVQGNGLSTVYPRSNVKLAESIIDNGALVSELPLDYRPLPANFPRRNRIISGMSTGVLVVEAALKSGSLITARCAMEQDRDVFAIPGSIHNPVARGCHSLIREGAKLVEQVQDITEEFGPMAAVVCDDNIQSMQPQQGTKGLDAGEKLLLDSIGYQPVDVDYLVESTGLSASIICSFLLNLEIKGLIESLSGGSYVRKS